MIEGKLKSRFVKGGDYAGRMRQLSRCLCIWKIISEYHLIALKRIVDILDEDYGYPICERTAYRDISAMMRLGIITKKRDPSEVYRVWAYCINPMGWKVPKPMKPRPRATVAAKIKPIYEERAKERQKCGQGGVLLPVNLPEASRDSRDEVGELLNVSGKSAAAKLAELAAVLKMGKSQQNEKARDEPDRPTVVELIEQIEVVA